MATPDRTQLRVAQPWWHLQLLSHVQGHRDRRVARGRAWAKQGRNTRGTGLEGHGGQGVDCGGRGSGLASSPWPTGLLVLSSRPILGHFHQAPTPAVPVGALIAPEQECRLLTVSGTVEQLGLALWEKHRGRACEAGGWPAVSPAGRAPSQLGACCVPASLPPARAL